MSNSFVDYLNSLHNDNAGNQNAIGEMQISNPFFASTQVKRGLITFLANKVREGAFVILTGHAGDGKTTLLSQVLDELGAGQKTLLPSADVSLDDAVLHYIKDFSELTWEKQDAELVNCFHRSGSSILIANTGPLLNAFKRLLGDGYENVLLDAMDSPAGNLFKAADHGEVYILNIARVDNTDFIRPYLANLVDGCHWTECDACSGKMKCPVYFNRTLIAESFDHVAGLIEKMYIWLQEYDNRATIRQLTAHLTFSLTGGLNCRTILEKGTSVWGYKYLTSNLFFGCYGGTAKRGAGQIRGVALMDQAGFDQRTTSADYDLFNKSDYKVQFPEKLALLLEEVAGSRNSAVNDSFRIVLKRAYLFFGRCEDVEKQQLIDEQIFSPWFDMYLKARTSGMRPKETVKTAICNAINTLFVGDSCDVDGDHIDLTLRRNNESTSNVQLLCGRISNDNIFVRCVPLKNVSGRAQYTLEFCTGNVRYPLSLPLINYFSEVHRGIIITDIDPMLSNGIDSLKAQLLSSCSRPEEEDSVLLVYLSGTKWIKRKLIIGDDTIDHD